MLGGATCSKGVIRISMPDVAFCDHTAWLVNTSVRDNVLSGSDLDELWYETVLEACALKKDLEMFPAGDSTLVRSRGLTLSGGQKQRVVSLAGQFPI